MALAELAHPTTTISAHTAQKLADKALLGELVGCALSSQTPLFTPAPTPHWYIPYHYLGEELMTMIRVDANTGLVILTDNERETILASVEERAIQTLFTRA